jgi:hypothetical protein
LLDVVVLGWQVCSLKVWTQLLHVSLDYSVGAERSEWFLNVFVCELVFYSYSFQYPYLGHLNYDMMRNFSFLALCVWSVKCLLYVDVYIITWIWNFSAMTSLNGFRMPLVCISIPSSTPWILRFGL